MKDNLGRTDLQQLFKTFPFLKGMHPVGRLDSDTSGILLFSRNGALTKLLLDPASKIERLYDATVMGIVHEDSLRKKLRSGVETADGTYYANLVSSRPITVDQVSDSACM